MGDKGRILLIDRHSQWLDFAVDILKSEGYTVFSASDFSAAIKRWQDQCFDLILLGLGQAESNLGVMSDLAKDRRYSRRIIVMFPVRQTHERMRIVFKAGAYDVVNKPYNKEALSTMVAQYIAEARQENHEVMAHVS